VLGQRFSHRIVGRFEFVEFEAVESDAGAMLGNIDLDAANA